MKHNIPGVTRQQFVISILQRFMSNEDILALEKKYKNACKTRGHLPLGATQEYTPTREEVLLWRQYIEGTLSVKEAREKLKIGDGTLYRRFGIISKLYLTDKLAKYE